MLKGIHLTLMIGPVIPVAVPQEVMDSLTDVSVTHSDDGPNTFQLSFNISNNSPLHILFLMSAGKIAPLMRVVIVVTLNGTPNVIMDGFITNHETKPGTTSGQSLLTITGDDITAVMNLQEFSGFPFPAVPAEGRVALMLAKYAFLGIIPMIIPSVLIDFTLPTTRIPAQRSTDLSYIRELAVEVGYVFYVEPGPAPGMNIAYWGPQIKVGVPQPALNINMDAHTNVESLSFNYTNTSAGLPMVYYHDEITKAAIAVPIPPFTPFNPPLGLLPPIPTKLNHVNDKMAKYSLPRSIMIGMAKVAQSADAVKGTGDLDVLRYGRVLKSRQLVGVRGAGLAYDGLYYVKSVTHKIKRGQYKQSFVLTRNGLISTLPRVPA